MSGRRACLLADDDDGGGGREGEKGKKGSVGSVCSVCSVCSVRLEDCLRSPGSVITVYKIQKRGSFGVGALRLLACLWVRSEAMRPPRNVNTELK